MAESRVTADLKKAGAKVVIGQQAKNIPAECDLVVYTNAIRPDNPELKEAKRRKIPMFTYPQVLGEISKNKFTIALSGTHGKTTVTAMVAKILMDAGLDPTVIVGSILNSTGTNYVVGKSQYLVVEADEYKRAFLNLSPKILGINNLDADHLDYFKNLKDVQSAFQELSEKVPTNGVVVCNTSDAHVKPVLKKLKATVVNYTDMSVEGWKLKVPGEHNRQNAKVAATVAGVVGVPEEMIRRSLESFEGTWRRFEYKGKMASGVLVYDDYAHNPQKVRAALQAAREMFPKNPIRTNGAKGPTSNGARKIIAVFQPHLYSRTKHFLKEFAASFGDADEILLAPIFAAREKFDKTISSEKLGKEITKNGGKVKLVADFPEIVKYLKKNTRAGTVIITIGAGDVYKVGEELLK